MKKIATSVRLSASDLSNHLACRCLTVLDLDFASGERPAPAWNSSDTQILQERGIARENAYVEYLPSGWSLCAYFRRAGTGISTHPPIFRNGCLLLATSRDQYQLQVWIEKHLLSVVWLQRGSTACGSFPGGLDRTASIPLGQ